jgi:hypothetical protein
MTTDAGFTVDGIAYITALASFIRSHESKLAEFNRRNPHSTSSTGLSWTSLLTLGLAPSTPAIRKPPLVLKFDPHHLYYLLLKFDELGINGIGSLDVLINGGPSRPMSYAFGGIDGLPFNLWTENGTRRRDDSDNRSTFSVVSSFSSFSLGSTWWNSTPPPIIDSTLDVKYLYSSCTKLPALRLTPFSFSKEPSAKSMPVLSKPVRDFEDCPPPDTAVPLYAFKNLQSLILEDLDPRAFLGWDVLAAQLRSLEVKNSAMEDIGELICDAVVEDYERRIKGRGGVGQERRKRRAFGVASGSASSEPTPSNETPAPFNETPIPFNETPTPFNETPTPFNETSESISGYRIPPNSAWQSLVHLSLASNSLTFIPSPPLAYLVALTSLDLSSNLLISIPPGLSSLTSLKFLNLSDNMIDSLSGISKALNSVVVLNLSKNRIENLSGLDRLDLLQRLDLRENRITESLEISRLAVLPVIQEVYILGNPFSLAPIEGGEENYRIKCFNYFGVDVHRRTQIKLDGAGPGISERRFVVVAAPLPLNGSSSTLTPNAVVVHPASKPTASPVVPDSISSVNKNISKRRKPRRIVELDSPTHSATTTPTTTSTTTHESSSEDASPHAHLLNTQSMSRSLRPDLPAKSKRRERVSASTFDSPSTGNHDHGHDHDHARGADQYRKKIEALREDVGENWMTTLAEMAYRSGRSNRSSRSSRELDRSHHSPDTISTTAANQLPDAISTANHSPDTSSTPKSSEESVVEVVVKVVGKGKKKKNHPK